MWKRFWTAVLLCGTAAAIMAAARTVTVREAEPSAVERVSASTGSAVSGSAADSAALFEAEAPLTLCLAYYDIQGRFISVEITENVPPDPETGETIFPIREIPPGAAKMKVFLLDQLLREAAPVTVGDFPTGGPVENG